jgi:hypothetical protein
MNVISNANAGFAACRSGGSSVIVAEQYTESFTTFDVARRIADFTISIDQLILQTVMVSFLVRMRFEFDQSLPLAVRKSAAATLSAATKWSGRIS